MPDNHQRVAAALEVVEVPLPHDLDLPTEVAQRHSHQRDADQKRPQTELKPAAFAIRRLGFGRLAFHRSIIPARTKPEQGIVGGRTLASDFLDGSLPHTC